MESEWMESERMKKAFHGEMMEGAEPKRCSSISSPPSSLIPHADEKQNNSEETRQREGRKAHHAKKTSCHRPFTPCSSEKKNSLASEFGITGRGSNEFNLGASFGIVKTRRYVPTYPENQMHEIFLFTEAANKRFAALKKRHDRAQASMFGAMAM
eukprot:CAMPEP_0170177854 /NCGR_PEP_ID=MMETSP0040_2-20121228/11228_1 /TAXON_ID=641309 /ORGANISM="Lotharella oceanica, Strain CCMP622" /LENGTH=154 /DNA_ID=CAMNT_0010420691 /DNA_START=195 /DNA_END=659 /DNA_ORIENTATION=+